LSERTAVSLKLARAASVSGSQTALYWAVWAWEIQVFHSVHWIPERTNEKREKERKREKPNENETRGKRKWSGGRSTPTVGGPVAVLGGGFANVEDLVHPHGDGGVAGVRAAHGPREHRVCGEPAERVKERAKRGQRTKAGEVNQARRGG
jgi:hypothetical protein